MLARLDWLSSVAVKPKPKKVNKDWRANIVRAVAGILASGAPTPFAFEATCRHAIRSKLCILGWRWSEADITATKIVKDGLVRIGAQRPRWHEGQPEWAQDGFAPILRTRCIRCRAPIPDGHTKFCSNLCGRAHFITLERIRSAEDEAAYDLVVRRVTFWKRADAA